jgi:hypothetical protein
MEKNKFQIWMEKNNYNDVRFYPKNTSAYGVTDMIECASKAIELYEDGQFSTYQDSIESFIDDSN